MIGFPFRGDFIKNQALEQTSCFAQRGLILTRFLFHSIFPVFRKFSLTSGF